MSVNSYCYQLKQESHLFIVRCQDTVLYYYNKILHAYGMPQYNALVGFFVKMISFHGVLQRRQKAFILYHTVLSSCQLFTNLLNHCLFVFYLLNYSTCFISHSGCSLCSRIKMLETRRDYHDYNTTPETAQLAFRMSF